MTGMSMKLFAADEVINAWIARRNSTTKDRSGSTIDEVLILRELAKGQPVSAERAAAVTGASLEQIGDYFAHGRCCGLEFNEAGELIGNVLTLKPTLHHFHMGGKKLYAWCSLDTIFLPGLLNETARVESTCPVTGEAIRLTVAPDGVTEYTPQTTVLSIVVPGGTRECAADQTGPESAVCSQMFFFSSPAAADRWIKDHPDVAMLTVEEAYQLARICWIEPYRRTAKGETSSSGVA